MTPEDVGVIPEWVSAVEQVAERARQMGEYPEIFDLTRLPDTLHRVIAASGTVVDTIGQYKRAQSVAVHHIGQFMRHHDLELPRSPRVEKDSVAH